MSERDLTRETAAAAALKESLAAMCGDDPSTLADMIEGETNLHESIAAVMAEIDEAEILERGLDSIIAEYEARRHRIKERIGRLKACIEQAMMVGELKRMTLPRATLTLRNNSPQVVVTDEAAIPAGFWKPRDPALDKSALRDALKDGKIIPGAALNNGGISLQIRRL